MREKRMDWAGATSREKTISPIGALLIGFALASFGPGARGQEAASARRAAPEVETPSALVVFAPEGGSGGWIVQGTPREVLLPLMELRAAPGEPVAESEWLLKQGVRFSPPQRDSVVAKDFAPPPGGPAISFRINTTAWADGRATKTLEFVNGRATIQGLPKGDYCLLVPGNPPLSATIKVEGGVAVVRAEDWNPLPKQLYAATLRDLSPEGFHTALTEEPFAQIPALIKRLKTDSRLTSVEMFLFYRGYYEALAKAQWLETAPDSSMEAFVRSLDVDNAYIDKVALEAMRGEDEIRSLLSQAGLGAGAVAGASPGSARADSFTGGIARLRSLYCVGMGTFFATEAEDRRIPAMNGQFVHPDLANLYSDQYRYLARNCLDWARSVDATNPFIQSLEQYIERTSETEEASRVW